MPATSGQGTVLNRNGTPIAEVTSITGPNMSRTTIDTTHLNTTDGYMQFITGLKDAGDLSFTINFTSDEYDKLRQDFEGDQAKDYSLSLPEGTVIEFSGYVTELPLSVPVNDRVTADITIKISGKPTINPGSGASV